MADFIEIGGRKLRVEVNWNAIVSFLDATGKNTWDGIVSLAQVTPADLAPLMAAAINEGERLEGRKCSYTAEDIGSTCGFEVIGKFLAIYQKQTMPKTAPPDEGKKKD